MDVSRRLPVDWTGLHYNLISAKSDGYSGYSPSAASPIMGFPLDTRQVVLETLRYDPPARNESAPGRFEDSGRLPLEEFRPRVPACVAPQINRFFWRSSAGLGGAKPQPAMATTCSSRRTSDGHLHLARSG